MALEIFDLDLNRGIHYFEQAIELDPGYALAYAGLADSYAVLSYSSNCPFDETFPKAKPAAEKAPGDRHWSRRASRHARTSHSLT